jgi:hypothetical protein
MGGLIATPGQRGYSDWMTVAGRKGRFNWSAAPHYDPGIGSGRSPMYLYETDDGNAYYHRLEKDLQGGRWELSGQSDEYERMLQDPEFIKQMWGDSDVAELLMKAVSSGVKWEDLPKFLKSVNTWRQISGD